MLVVQARCQRMISMVEQEQFL